MPIFDGDNLLITLDSGVTTIDAEQDLYSAWKDWQLEDGVSGRNTRFPQAFRTVGGDALTPGIDAGAYFFLQNQLGWRIKPAEEDATILLTGNLTPEDSNLPILIPTTGDFSVLVDGLQPITQSVETILIQQQLASYNGKVYVDFLRGIDGTNYPIGLHSTPTSTSQDAHTISISNNLFWYVIIDGTHIIIGDHISYQFEGLGGASGVDINGFDVSGSIFTRLIFINSNFTNTPDLITIKKGSIVSGATNIHALIENTGINGIITLKQTNGIHSFTDCFSYQPGTATPIIDCQNNTGVLLQMRGYNGGVELKNYSDSTNLASFDLNAGHLILSSGCTAGLIVARGVGHITDNSSSGCTVIRTGFVEGDYLTELWKIKGLDIDDQLVLKTISDSEVDMNTEDVKVKITDSGNIRTIKRQ